MIGIGILSLLLFVLGYVIYTNCRTLRTTEIYVTTVDYDVWRKVTWVYGANNQERVFAGLHYDIKAGNIYRLEYYPRIPWSKLENIELIGEG